LVLKRRVLKRFGEIIREYSQWISEGTVDKPHPRVTNFSKGGNI
jgi:hypothetical protein